MKHEQAPESELLRSLKERGDPFETPPEYFEEQSKKMMALLDEEEDPIPSFGERQADPFSTPAGYFERFPQALFAEIDAEEASVRSMRRYVFPVAIAAAMALLIALGWIVSTDQSGFNTSPDYFSESISDFSEQEMLALLDQEDVELGLLLEMMPEQSILPEENFSDDFSEEEDEALDALFEELDPSDLESILMP